MTGPLCYLRLALVKIYIYNMQLYCSPSLLQASVKNTNNKETIKSNEKKYISNNKGLLSGGLWLLDIEGAACVFLFQIKCISVLTAIFDKKSIWANSSIKIDNETLFTIFE